MEEAAQVGGVVAVTVVVQGGGGVPSAGGEQVRIADGAGVMRGRVLGQPVAVGARGGRYPRPAVDVIGVAFRHRPGRMHQQPDRPRRIVNLLSLFKEQPELSCPYNSLTLASRCILEKDSENPPTYFFIK